MVTLIGTPFAAFDDISLPFGVVPMREVFVVGFGKFGVNIIDELLVIHEYKRGS